MAKALAVRVEDRGDLQSTSIAHELEPHRSDADGDVARLTAWARQRWERKKRLIKVGTRVDEIDCRLIGHGQSRRWLTNAPRQVHLRHIERGDAWGVVDKVASRD